MFNFFKGKKKKIISSKINLSKIASLLIHAAKIDEKYTEKEKDIIKNTLIMLGIDKNKIDPIMLEAENNEEKSNQIIDFTREVKNLNEDEKKKIIESLWTIVYSDEESDIYESNLMRRLSGLLYLDNKIVGDIKEKVKLKISNK